MSDALSDIRKADRNRPMYSQAEYEKIVIEKEKYLNNWLCEQQRIADVIAELEKRNDECLLPGNFGEGRIMGRKEAISLLKNGVKKDGA